MMQYRTNIKVVVLEVKRSKGYAEIKYSGISTLRQ